MAGQGLYYAAYLSSLKYTKDAKVFLYPGTQGPGTELGTLSKPPDATLPLLFVKDTTRNLEQIVSLDAAFMVSVYPYDASQQKTRIDVLSSGGGADGRPRRHDDLGS